MLPMQNNAPAQGLGATEQPRPMGKPQVPEANMPGPHSAGGSGGLQDATPQEQEIYDRFLSMAVIALHDDKMLPKTVEFLRSAPSPVEGIAEVASQLTLRVYTEARDKGMDVPGDILLNAGAEVIEAVVEVVEEAGIATISEEQMEVAMYAAADKFTKAAADMGVYDAQKAQTDLDGLNSMADSGELGAMVPALKQPPQERA